MLKYEHLSNPTENQIKSVCFTYRHDFGFLDKDIQVATTEQAKKMWELIANYFADKPIAEFQFNPTEAQLKKICKSFLECGLSSTSTKSEECFMFETKEFWRAIYKEVTEPSYISRGA